MWVVMRERESVEKDERFLFFVPPPSICFFLKEK